MRRSWLALVAGFMWLALASVLQAGPPAGHDKSIDDYNFAAWLYNQGKYPLAAESYRVFIDTHRDHEKVPDARFGLAQSLFYQDQFAAAADAYEALRTTTSEFAQMAEVLFQLAQCRVALGQFAEAEPLFGSMRAQFGGHDLADWAGARQAACLISLERYPEASALLEPFVERYASGDGRVEDRPATRELLKKLEAQGIKAHEAFLSLVERSLFYLGIAQFNEGRFAVAQPSLEHFLHRYPGSALAEEAQFRLAQSQYQQKSYAAAAESYRAAAAGTNRYAESAAFERGLALYRDGKVRDAAQAFSEVTARFPTGAQAGQAALYAGMFLFEAGDFAGAEKTLAPLVEAKTAGTEDSGYWLGMSLLKQGRAPTAEAAFAAMLATAPSASRAGDARLGLGDALLAQNKPVEAAAAFRQFADEHGEATEAPRALYSACVALHRAESYTESDAGCDTFLQRFAGDALAPQVIFLSGENRFLVSSSDRAAARYRELLARKDVSAESTARARFRLAWVARNAKQFAPALDELAQIQAADAGPVLAAEMRYLQGVCQAELGQTTQAVATLETYWKEPGDRRYGEDTLLRLAAAQAANGRPDLAIDAYERFLKTYAGSELANQSRYQLAETLYEQKKYDRAVKQYEEVLAAQPGGPLAAYAVFGSGLCRADQKQNDKAVESFARVAREFPTSDVAPQARYRQARSLMDLQRWPEATEVLRALLKDAPKHTVGRGAAVSLAYCLQEQKDWPAAAEAFRNVVDRYDRTNDLPRLYYEQAWSWREAGKTNEAVAAFRVLADKFPADALAADANFHLGEAEYAEATAPDLPADRQKQTLEAARSRYELVLKAAGQGPLADKAHYRIGWTWWLQQRFPEAAAAFDRVVMDFPASDLRVDSLFQAAQAQAHAGKAEVAVERYTTLLDDNKYTAFPYRSEAIAGLADCLIVLGRQEEAVRRLDDARRAGGTTGPAGEAVFLMGKAQFDLQRYDEAVRSFEEVTAQTRSEVAARAQFYIGQVHQAQEKYSAALLAYLRVLAIYPTSGEWVAAATFESGKCQEALGAGAEARQAYQSVVDQHAGTSWATLAGERLAAMGKGK